MNSRKSHKRKRGNNPILEGDVRLAEAVTPKTITETKNDGSIVTKKVWISLDTPSTNLTAEANAVDMPPALEVEPENMSPPENMSTPIPERTHTYRVSIYQIKLSILINSVHRNKKIIFSNMSTVWMSF